MGPQPCVLVVDDDIYHLMVFERAFKHDFKLCVAWSGLEALDILREEHIDVVIADYAMPGLNGLALLRQVRNDWPAVGRILMTARVDLDFIADAKAEGVIEALVGKPWDALEMRDQALRLFRARLTA